VREEQNYQENEKEELSQLDVPKKNKKMTI
jgi:hypothetical protein